MGNAWVDFWPQFDNPQVHLESAAFWLTASVGIRTLKVQMPTSNRKRLAAATHKTPPPAVAAVKTWFGAQDFGCLWSKVGLWTHCVSLPCYSFRPKSRWDTEQRHQWTPEKQDLLARPKKMLDSGPSSIDPMAWSRGMSIMNSYPRLHDSCLNMFSD